MKFRLSRTFFEIFLKFFSGAESLEMPSKAVVMRFSAAVCVALAPDSLTIIPPRKHFVNTFFSDFLTNFSVYGKEHDTSFFPPAMGV